jgi:hypothetical protein
MNHETATIYIIIGGYFNNHGKSKRNSPGHSYELSREFPTCVYVNNAHAVPNRFDGPRTYANSCTGSSNYRDLIPSIHVDVGFTEHNLIYRVLH